MLQIKDYFESHRIHFILGFFVFLFVLSVIFSSFILLFKTSDVGINVIESESYSRSLALKNNQGVAEVLITNQIEKQLNNKNETPSFPAKDPSQNYLIPETGVFENKFYLYVAILTSPFILAWILVRLLAFKKIQI